MQHINCNLQDIMKHYSFVRRNMMIKLVNREFNKEYLKEKVYVPFLDLAAVFYVIVRKDEEGIRSMALLKIIFDSWNVDVSKVYDDVLGETMDRFPMKMVSLPDMIDELSSAVFGNDDTFSQMMNPPETEQSGDIPYIITNNMGINGATVILYHDTLKQLAHEMNTEKIYLLPSSIHEWIAVSAKGDESIETLMEMVKQVNGTVILKTDKLSDNV